MSSIPYDSQRCSLFRPANLDQIAATERQNKDFFSDVIINAINSESDLCVELSRLAYFKFEEGKGKQKELEAKLAKAKLESLHHFSTESAQGYVATDGSKIFLVFRGNETVNLDENALQLSVKSVLQLSLKSILRRILISIWRLRHFGIFKLHAFLKRPRPAKKFNVVQFVLDVIKDVFFIKANATESDKNLRGYVHRGFLAAFAESKLEWEGAVHAAAKDNDKAIVICGHSRGAALASLAAAYLAVDFLSRVRLHTFGSPRVGDEDFVASMEGVTHRRYVNCRDMVTRIPPEFFCYSHHGKQIYIDSGGQVITANPDPAVVKADRKQALWSYFSMHKKLPFQNKNVWFRGLADHAPINYVSGVLKLR